MYIKVEIKGEVVRRIELGSTGAFREKQNKMLGETGAADVRLGEHGQKRHPERRCRGSGLKPSDVGLQLTGQGINVELLSDRGEIRVIDVGEGSLGSKCRQCGGRFTFDEESGSWHRS